MTTIPHQLAAAARACADLADLGVRVIAVKVDIYYDLPRIQVANPEPLLAHLDPVETGLTDLCYRQRAVRVADCEVYWIVAAPREDRLSTEELLRGYRYLNDTPR